MKVLSLPTLAAALAIGFARLSAAATPTLAAAIASCENDMTSTPDQTSNTYTSAIDEGAPAILAGLRDKGINAVDVSNWGGCVKADVVGKDGKTSMEFFDPASLERLSVNG